MVIRKTKGWNNTPNCFVYNLIQWIHIFIYSHIYLLLHTFFPSPFVWQNSIYPSAIRYLMEVVPCWESLSLLLPAKQSTGFKIPDVFVKLCVYACLCDLMNLCPCERSAFFATQNSIMYWQFQGSLDISGSQPTIALHWVTVFCSLIFYSSQGWTEILRFRHT